MKGMLLLSLGMLLEGMLLWWGVEAGWWLGLICLAGVVWGVWLVRGQEFALFSALAANWTRGILPTAEGIEGLLLLLGGWALIAPGFLGDLFGIVVSVPVLRRWIVGRVRGYLRGYLARGDFSGPR